MERTAHKYDYDAVVVGSGPNGLSAAITLQREGLSVLVLEAKATIGGGMRSAELTLPGFRHDVCSAIHPLAIGSPFFRSLPLADYGLEFIQPTLSAAHPFDDGTAAALRPSVDETARSLGADEKPYRKLLAPLVRDWPTLAADVLGPLRLPEHPLQMARFGLNALLSATQLASRFATKEGQGLLAGMAAHAMQPLTNLTTAAVALVLITTGHRRGWPIPKGGSQTLANALAAYFQSLGGQIQTSTEVCSMRDIPSARVVLFDVTPRQLLRIVGDRFPARYRTRLETYRYGMGVF